MEHSRAAAKGRSVTKQTRTRIVGRATHALWCSTMGMATGSAALTHSAPSRKPIEAKVMLPSSRLTITGAAVAVGVTEVKKAACAKRSGTPHSSIAPHTAKAPSRFAAMTTQCRQWIARGVNSIRRKTAVSM